MSHNQYRLITMDKRHKGCEVFSHYVDFRAPVVWQVTAPVIRAHDFQTRRVWCWENFGPGLELDYTSYGVDTKWAWWRDDSHMNLYFAGASLSAYLLTWH